MQRTPTKQRPSSTQEVAEITTPAHSNIYIPQYSEIEMETDSESEYYTYLAHTSLLERKENKTPTRETNTLHSYIEEAKSAHKQALINLNNSRNLKREIKEGIENAVKRLFKVFKETIKELESSNLRKNTNSTHLPPSPPPPPSTNEYRNFSQKIEEHSKLLAENNKTMDIIRKELEGMGRTNIINSVKLDKLDKLDTLDNLNKLEKLENGISKQIETYDIQNKNPLVVIRDVLNYNTDEEILAALQKQNKDIFNNYTETDKMEILYKKKAKNPQTNHVVIRVPPQVWKSMMEAGKVRIDLQKLRVEDQSPLIQCSTCLGYGHPKRFCKDKEEKCSHCGGSHKRSECEEWKNKSEPTCCNCKQAKVNNHNHNAFSQECPIRRKWEQIARSTIAYS
ncbi:uncharacterized protein LOC123722314 [Papilio machaon]|uniref:uncharacterized protein LOC123722314 n=1 Tax=Papilio machaon TaxID=76193 RepID=UPI001E6643A8|nr:uncharacterized protein LOC123722314 [Papilio machaon]